MCSACGHRRDIVGASRSVSVYCAASLLALDPSLGAALLNRYQCRALQAGVNVFMLDVDIGMFEGWPKWRETGAEHWDFVAQRNRPCAIDPNADDTVPDFNTGVFFARSSRATLSVFQRLVAQEDKIRADRWVDPSDKNVLGVSCVLRRGARVRL